MANAGITFDFAAESAKLRSEIDKVRKEVSSLNQTAKSVEKGFKLVGGAIAGAISIGAITGWVRTINQAADQLNDLSTRLGAGAAELQVLQIAAQQAGGSAEAMNTALAKMTSTIGDAIAGNREAAAAFERLGLSLGEISQLRADEAFRRISTALSEVPNSYSRASLAQDIFGKGAKDIAGVLNNAPAVLDEVNARLETYGAKLSNLDIDKIGVVNDELSFQQTVVQNLGTAFVADLSPAVLAVTDSFQNIITSISGATSTGQLFGVAMTATVKLLEAGVQGLISWFELWRGVGAKLWEGITFGASKALDVLADVAGALGLDVADGLRQASDAAAEWSEQFRIGADAAFASADRARQAAIAAGKEMMNAGAVYRANNAEVEAAALEAQRQRDEAARRSGAAGARGGAAGAAVAGNSGGLTVSKDSLGTIDPQIDPEVLQRASINSTLQTMQDQHDATMIGKLESFNTTTLGMMLSNADMMQQIEFAKNATVGDAMGSLVQMAIAQGGTLAKVGKGLYIAQTVWATSNAIMEVMGYRGPGWPQNVAVAASIAAMGAAQIANIKKTNPGTGGSIVSGRGGGAATPSPALSDNVGPAGQPLEQQSVAQVHIHGNVFSSEETAAWFIEKIRDAVDSRDVVLISGNSRQAMEFARG